MDKLVDFSGVKADGIPIFFRTKGVEEPVKTFFQVVAVYQKVNRDDDTHKGVEESGSHAHDAFGIPIYIVGSKTAQKFVKGKKLFV